MSHLFRSVLAALCICAGQGQAHEFWIEPEAYAVAPGEMAAARFRNGEHFKGSTLSWIPRRAVSFEVIDADGRRDVPARIGDNPAFAMDDLAPGLVTILHETTDTTLTYDDFETFERFAAHKALGDAPARHLARGLPRDAVRERYRRYAKALVAVGDGAGQDARSGLLTEFVLGANPYADDLSGGLPVQVWLGDAPKAGAQIEMFDKAPDGSVDVTLHDADAEGRAVLPVVEGHSYLLDSVTLEEVEPIEDGDPAWASLWAALTFAVPEE